MYTNENGQDITAEQVKQSMEISGYSDLSSYLKMAGLTPGKKKGSVTNADPDPDPNAESWWNTGLGSEDGFSESASLKKTNIKTASGKKTVSPNFLAPIQGIEFDKATGSYIQANNEADIFKQEEEEAVPTLRKLYEGTGLQFEESNFQNDINVQGEDILMGLLTSMDVAEVSIPGVKETIKLQLDSDNPKITASNLKLLKNYTEKYKSFLKAPVGNKSDITKYKNWVDNDKSIKDAEVKASNDYLKNTSLFTERTETKVTGYVGPGMGPGQSMKYEVVVKPYEKELQNTAAALKKMYPKLSAAELTSNTQRLVRNQLYQSKVVDAKLAARETAISNGIMSQEDMYAAAYFITKDQGAKYNQATKKLDVIADSKKDLNNVIEILNQEAFSEEDNNIVLNWGARNGLAINPDAEIVTLKNGQKVSSSFIDVANQVNATAKSQELLYKNTTKEQDNALAELDDAALTSTAAGKNYDLHEKYLTNVGIGSLDLVMGGVALLGSAGTGLYGLATNDYGAYEDVTKFGADYSQYSQKIREQYTRDVSFEEGFNSPGNFGKFLAQEVSNQIPILLAMAASGGTAAPYVIGATSAGSQLMDMQSEIALDLELDPEGKPKYSQTEIWLKSIGVGAAEGVFAGLTTVPILQRANKTWINAGKEQLLKDNLKAYYNSISKRGIIYEGILEMAGETATTGAQNLITEKPFTEGMDHAGFSGFGFGFAFAGIPFLKGAYNAKFSSYENLSAARAIQEDINKLGKSYANAKTNNLRAKLKELIESKSVDLAAEISKQEDLINNNLNSRGAQYIISNISQQANLQRQAKAIQEAEGLSADIKKAKLKELQEEFNKLVAIKNNALQTGAMLKNETEWKAFESQNPNKYKEYIDTATSQLYGEKKGKDSSDKDVSNRAYDLYYGDLVRAENSKQKSNKGAFSGKDFKSFETVAEAEAYVESRADLTPEEKAKINLGLKNGNDGVAMKPTDNNKAVTLAVVENQVANQRKYTRTHEVGHQAFWSIFSSQKNEGAFQAISNQLLKTLKSMDAKVHAELLSDSIYTDDGALDPAEVISKVLEYAAEGKINNRKAKGIAGLFGVMTQQKFGSEYDFDFRGETDIFNFVVGIAKKISSGELSTADIKATKESKLVSKLESIEGVSITEDSKTNIAASKSVLDTINELVPAEVTTQDQYFNRKVFNPIYKATENNGVISNYVKSKSPSKEVAAKTIKSIQERLVNYDPAAERKKAGNKQPITFGEFIFANTNFGKLDAKKALFKESEDAKKTTDLDNKEAQSKIAEDDVAKKDTPKFRKLIDSGVLPGVTIKDIGSKLTKVLKVLKSRLDAKVSINKSVSPLIAEIKQAMGKQADIDLKEAMGGKADAKLQKWLLKNKKAVLENMTTTWLMGAIPQAIQKSVGGTYKVDDAGVRIKDSYGDFTFVPNFTSDWQGKTVDREKTSTNKLGKTAGGDIVRRLPNIATALSDADFVSSVLEGVSIDEDGNMTSGAPIRGRKESMAKAIAEEISLEVFNRELQNENSEISKAFENNQAALGVVLAEAFVEDVGRQIERGQIKFSETFTPEQVQEALSDLVKTAVMRGASSSEFEIVKSEYPEEIVKFGEDLGLFAYFDEGKTGFKAPLKEFKAPKEFESFFDKYFSTITNKNNETSMEQMADFSEALIDILPPEVLDALPDDMFGIQYGYLDGGAKKADSGVGKYNWLANKKRAKQKTKSKGELKLPFDPKGIEIFNAGYGLMNQIATILNKNFPSAEAKRLAVMEEFGDRINAANANNLLALDYLIQEATKVIAKNPTLIPGFLRWMESSTSNAKAQRGLTTLDLIEYRAESQKSGVDHPLYKRALKFATERAEKNYSKLPKSKQKTISLADFTKKYLANPRTGVESYLRFKGEHVSPAANVMLELAKNAITTAAVIIKHPGGKSQALTSLSIKNSLDLANYSQTLGAKIWSDFQDVALGTTSKLGDLRGLVLNNKDLNTFFSHDGVQAINYIKRKLISLESIKNLYNSLDVEQIASVSNKQKAIDNGRKMSFSSAPKKIRVFDFDDTLARTKSNVLYTMPDGTTGKIDAATFAKDAGKMEAEGAQWDFSEFSKVMDGKAGPLLEVAKIIADKRGTKDVFVLTARPADAAGPIQEFLASMGLNIPIENITGLGNGTPKAKADWVIGKVADGYNDFYFADDHTGNVKAVKDVLDTFDVKGKVQLAKVKFSKSLDVEFNDMIQRHKGVESFKEFSKATAQRRGKKTGKWKFFISPSAEDFRGLTQYKFAGKGKQGEADQKFFEESLMDPYFQGVAALESARQTIKEDTKALLSMFNPVKKKLNKLIPNEQYTYDAAVRVYLWNKAGNEIPGLSKRDNKKLNDLVANDPELSAFADGLLLVSKKDSWPEPGEHWLAQTTLSDLNNLTEKANRKEYLAEFIENVDIVFSEKNLNKVEALYGEASRKAIENAISAMKSGSNSANQGGDAITSKWTQWVNNSIGTIMFFNRRSAILQTLSSANFINWSDNNPAKAALAFANQPQYWKDFAMIFNSDKLKQRRGGLKSDVQEAEIANAAKNAQDKAGAIVAYILKLGFTPTQIADSFAISLGGASLYRNRVKTYTKQGMDLKDAETKAFQDFTKLSDESQQSGDPALVSQQQRSVAGRLILSFQNTTMQYTRLMKKHGQDLINNRGDKKTHVSAILYFGAVQNFLFNALSKTAFALIPGFDEDEEEDDEKRDKALENKAAEVLNSMSDSVVRGTGIYGAIFTTLKNSFLTWEREKEKGFTGDQTKTILELANLSPAIGSKLRKVYSGIQAYSFDRDVIEKHPWSVTIDGRFNPSSTYSILANVASAGLNLPLDRALAEARGVAEMLDDRNSKLQRIALGLGWRTWNVGAKNEEFDLIKADAKVVRKKEGREKAKVTRAETKGTLQELENKMDIDLLIKYYNWKKGKSQKEKIIYLKNNKK